VTTAEDTPVAISLTAGDPDGDPLSWTVGTAQHGTLDGIAPNLTYTPELNYNGPDSFTFTVYDAELGSNTATVSITITAANDPPTADDQSVSTLEDTPVDITLIAGDVDGDPLTWTVGTPQHGSLTGTAPGLHYVPEANYNGPDSFTFSVNDGELDSNTATVNITVTPVIDAPVAYPQEVMTDEDVTAAITLTGSDPDGDPLQFLIRSDPQHGYLSGWAPNLIYHPNLNYNGPDSFTFRISDSHNFSDTVTVSITVNPVNDAPTANNQSVTTPEDTPVDITLIAGDVDGDPLTWTVGTPAHGTLTGTAPTLTYTPSANYRADDSFTFTVNDGQVDSNTATVSITVSSVNDPPTANDQTVTTPEDTPLAITLTAGDPDGDPLTWTVGTPEHGAITGTAPNLTYAPNLNYHGPDSLTFKVNDGALDSNTATVVIMVTSVNDPPVTHDQSVETDEDISVAINLVAGDVDGDALTWSIGTPQHGALTGTAPNLIYAPALNYNGPDGFTFTVSDGVLASNTATVSITVTPVNDPPVANGQSVAAQGGVSQVITLSASDVDGDPLNWIVGTPLHGTLTGTAPNLTYTASGGYNGADSFTFKVNDGQLDSLPATVSITVTSINHPPVVQVVRAPVDPVNVDYQPIFVSGSFTDIDPGDTHTATWNWGDGSTSTGVVDQTTHTVTGNHTYAETGVYEVTLIVRDAGNAISQRTYQYVVVYDPEAGFVTGAGIVNSPAGAYRPNPSLTGCAVFGFVSKYKRFSIRPSGCTAFAFLIGGMLFHSDDYDWLVVNDYRAQYRGTGTINGGGSYGFILTAIDGDKIRRGNPDRFRIKIWNKANGQLIYDNQIYDPDSADPTTAISCGEIMIHK